MPLTRMRSALMACAALSLCLALLACAPAGADDVVSFEGEKSAWRDGFERYDFVIDESSLRIEPFKRDANEGFGTAPPPPGKRRCVVVAPHKPAPGNPWSWRGCYWDHQPQTEVELLKRGFHIAYVSADANRKPDKTWDAWYEFLTARHGLSKKPAFIGMSRGGEYAYTWASGHPDRVSCIYADNPGANPEVFRKLFDLAAADVPLLHVCGGIDPLLWRVSSAIESTYKGLGGRISVVIKDGAGHHPHSLRNPRPIADFIERSFREPPPEKPAFAAGRTTHTQLYTIENVYKYESAEGAYLSYRGPAFAPSYVRWTFELAGVEGSIQAIVPNKPAPGGPWVLRADAVGGDSHAELALLEKGFAVVTGPVPYNADGPSLAAWNRVYEHLAENGFSRRPVLAGVGGAAGDAYAWAIENPDKVACIYAFNPLLKSGMTKRRLLEDLGPPAGAGVPILHVCGALDPLLESQTRTVERRYRELGGKLAVIVREGVGHEPAQPGDPAAVVEFVLRSQNRDPSGR